MRRAWLCLLLAALALAGCFDQAALLQKLVPPEEDRQARNFLDHVREGRMAEARAMLDPALSRAEVDAGLVGMRTIFIQSKWVKVETIGFHQTWNSNLSGQSQTTIKLDYQIQQEQQWLAGTIVFSGEAADRKITTARFNQYPASLAVLNAFTFAGKGPLHYLVLLLAVATPLFCLVALILCIRTRLRRKWLWVLFVFLSAGKISLNWSTGQWGFQLLAVQLLGASAFKSGAYAPWILSVGFPLGAVIFLLRRKALALPAAAPRPPTLPQ